MLNKYFRMGLGVIAICMSLAFATVPQTITFQGRLTESGIPVEGTRTMRFAIVNTTGTVVWANTDSSVALSQGIYTFELGTTPPLTPAILDTTEKLSIRVWVENVQLSDIPLNSAPYAYLAANASSANYATIANNINLSATSGQVLKFNGTTWGPGTDNNTPTTYTAGTGISLSGTTINSTIVGNATHTGDVTGATALTIANGAVNSAKIADAAITGAKIASQNAASGQVLKWTGTTWTPSDDIDTDTNTTYTAGTGLVLSSTTFSVSSNIALRDATNTFTAAQSIGAVANRTIQIAPSTNADVVEFIY